MLYLYSITALIPLVCSTVIFLEENILRLECYLKESSFIECHYYHTSGREKTSFTTNKNAFVLYKKEKLLWKISTFRNLHYTWYLQGDVWHVLCSVCSLEKCLMASFPPPLSHCNSSLSRHSLWQLLVLNIFQSALNSHLQSMCTLHWNYTLIISSTNQ